MAKKRKYSTNAKQKEVLILLAIICAFTLATKGMEAEDGSTPGGALL